MKRTNDYYTNGTVTIKVIKREGDDITYINNHFVHHMRVEYLEENFKKVNNQTLNENRKG